MKKTFTTFQVAKICEVSPSTVIHWVNKGQLAAYRTPGRHRRIQTADLLKFLKRYGMPIPKGLSEGPTERKKVLIVDDDVQVANMIKKAFSRRSELFEARAVNDGIEALVLIGKWLPDLVVLDVVMPVIDGSKVCASLKSDPQTRHIRIIAVTGKKISDSQRQYLLGSADAYFTKPFDVVQMLETAARLLAGAKAAV